MTTQTSLLRPSSSTMTGIAKSRWADDDEVAAAEAQRKREKEEKKRLKVEKQLKIDEIVARQRDESATRESSIDLNNSYSSRPAKRQKVAIEELQDNNELLHSEAPSWQPSRNVSAFECLNHIEEGSYGWVSRAKDRATGEIVALKKLKMDIQSGEGFPVTGLREIQCLMEARGHLHIVALREIVVGNGLDEVFLVMEFLEHDLKTLHEEMREPWLMSEVKTLMGQLCDAVGFLHDHWILHRDLKTSNILMNNRGEIRIADFGMARHFGDPPPKMTQLVVTLWYRAPELLLGAEKYDQAIDIWSLGCIFGELLTKEPLLQGKNEVDQLSKIFELCGIPSEESWPGFKRLPYARSLRHPRNPQSIGAVIRIKFPFLTSAGSQLLTSLLSLNPAGRPNVPGILEHHFFAEDPRPKSKAMFPTFPSKAGQEKVRRFASPSAPRRGEAQNISGEMDFSSIFAARDAEEVGAGFQLKLG